MCGRFLSVSDPELLAERFEVDEVRTEPLPPRWNVAPSLDVYAVIEREDTRRLGTLRWGFVPHWTKRLRGARTPINARLESVATTSMFATSFAKRRCLVPADGFYEWQVREDGSKQPYHLHAPDGAPLALGGVWTVWRDPAEEADEPVFSTAIVTTVASGALADIHERVPLIVPRQLWSDWLTATPEEAPHLEEAVRALAPPTLVAEPISTRVNDVRNEGPELLEPATDG
ncbi:SOS response-associated peptidase [Nitriliruptor alkaliphilus]|uniref:SOS response-associated peptidase n=1 Tax=Nitriliruptor alkaliphilus TaxID=427918 RepID=UPI000697D812|nr:SOS response-associated peptidase [Nitriliruptor alkaliphilus]